MHPKEATVMNRRSSRLTATAFLVASVVPAAVVAHEVSDHRVVDGVEMYVGVLPAETLRAQHAKGDPEFSMHNGVPTRAGYYHVNLSLFDSDSKAPIDDARVEARVEELGGMGAQSRAMEKMAIKDTVSYGNYFKMPGKGPYWITVTIRRPEPHRVIEAKFPHKHF
jgi:hypothetical protein